MTVPLLEEVSHPAFPRVAPHLVTTEQELREVVEYFMRQPAFVLDVETTIAPTPALNEVLWIGLATYGKVSLIPIGHPHGPKITPEFVAKVPDHSTVRPYANDKTGTKFTKPKLVSVTHPATFGPVPRQLRPDVAFEILKPLFFSGKTIIGHNIKFDIMSVGKYYPEMPPGPFEDTILLTHILDESRPDYGLKPLITQWILGIRGRRKEVRDEFYPNLGKYVVQEGLYDIARYLAKDVFFTWTYWCSHRPRLVAEELEEAYYLECALLNVLLAMEHTGVYTDISVIEAIGRQLDADIRMLEIDIWRICGEQFELTLKSKLRHYFFGDKKDGGQGLKPLTYTEKTNEPQLNKAVMEHYADSNPLAKALLEWTSKHKLKSAFVVSLTEARVNGRIHTSFNQHRAETGRLSSSGPNLQQVPRPKKGADKGTQLREVFAAAPGHKLIVADYDQIELRCIAYLANDPEMIRLFASGMDIHSEAAASMLGLPIEAVGDAERNVGKQVNFSVGYGASEYRVAAITGRTVDEARLFIERYFQRFSAVPGWKERELLTALRRGNPRNPIGELLYVVILGSGRRRRIKELMSDDFKVRASGQRQAINALVQGFAANIMKKALIDLHYGLRQYAPDAHLELTVHDEVMVEAPTFQAEQVGAMVTHYMQGVTINGRPALGPVPLIASAGIGDNWLEAK